MTVNTLGSDSRPEGDSAPPAKSPDSRTVAEWLWPFFAGGVALFSISALFYYHFHRQELEVTSFLQRAIASLYEWFGLAPAVVFFLLVFAWSSIWLVTGLLEKPAARFARLCMMAVMLGVFFNLGDGGVTGDVHKGELGAWIAVRLVAGVGYAPSLVLVWLTTFASVILATDWFFSDWFERGRQPTNLEVGVEDEVTEHLRGLAEVTNESGSLAPSETLQTGTLSDDRDAAQTTEPLTGGFDGGDDDVDGGAGAERSSATIASGPQKYTDRRKERAERRRRAAESVVSQISEPIAETPVGVEPASEPVTEPALRRDDLHPDSGSEAEAPVAVSETEGDPQSEVDVTQEVEDVDEWVGGELVNSAELDEEDVGEDEADETEDGLEDPDDGDYQEDEEGYEEEGEEEEEDVEEEEEEEYEEEEEDVEEEGEYEEEEGDDRDGSVIAESTEEQERVVPISRPDRPPSVALPTPPAVDQGESLPARRQQKLFGVGVDDGLMEEAAALALTGRRTTATLLQRKLRIDYELAVQVLSELEARGLLSGGKHPD